MAESENKDEEAPSFPVRVLLFLQTCVYLKVVMQLQAHRQLNRMRKRESESEREEEEHSLCLHTLMCIRLIFEFKVEAVTTFPFPASSPRSVLDSSVFCACVANSLPAAPPQAAAPGSEEVRPVPAQLSQHDAHQSGRHGWPGRCLFLLFVPLIVLPGLAVLFHPGPVAPQAQDGGLPHLPLPQR